MLAAVAIGLGLVLGLASGGRFSNLRYGVLRWQTPILLLFLVQGVARGAAAPMLGRFAVAIWAACSTALFVLLILQSSQPGLAVAGLGIGLNTLVVLANSGMPVGVSGGLVPLAAEAVKVSGGFYHIADERTSLVLLADILPAGSGVASIGDVLLAVGVAAFLVSVMVAGHRSPSRRLRPPLGAE